MTRLHWCAIVALLLPSFAPASAQVTRPRAMWVWHPSALLDDMAERRTFLDFCDRHRIGVVWAQIATRGAGTATHLDDGEQWRTLLADVHHRGIALHALDGDPQYAARPQHDALLSTVDAVIGYNASVTAAERFDGIHFDIEPYALAGWNELPARERLIADYLDVNARAAARSHAAGLAYGVDIPFWWQSVDATGRLLDSVDNVGLMDYRNAAAGSDGIIAHAIETLDRTDKAGEARVFVGVETGTGRGGETMPAKVTFAGASLRDMNAELAAAETALAARRSYAGMAIHDYSSFRRLADGQP